MPIPADEYVDRLLAGHDLTGCVLYLTRHTVRLLGNGIQDGAYRCVPVRLMDHGPPALLVREVQLLPIDTPNG